MVGSPKNLSHAARWSLVIGLWVVLFVLIALAVRNIGWVLSWANGIFVGCIFFVGLLLAFSFVAAAVHLSVDTIKGRYPYPTTDDRFPHRQDAKYAKARQGTNKFAFSSVVGSRRRVLLNVLAVAAITLVLTLVLLELGLRLFAPQTSPEMQAALWNELFTPDSSAIYRNTPGVNTTFRLDESTTRWSTNSQGLREDHEVGSPTPGTVRILNLGDSFVFGYGVEENQAFSYLLNGSVMPRAKRIESINAGVSGYGTDNEAAWMHTYGWAYKPDIVLVSFFVGNDVQDVLRNDNRISVDSSGSLAIVPSNAPPAWEVAMPVPDNPAARAKDWLAVNSHAYVFLRRMLHDVLDPFSKATVRDVNQFDTAPIYYKSAPADIEEGWGRVARLLDFMNREAQAHGARLAVVLIPAREQVEDVYWSDLKAGFGLTDANLDQDGPQRKLAEWSTTSGVPLIDLLPGFRAAQGGPYYFRKDPHWNAAGQKLAAHLIAQGLAKLGF